MDAPLQISFRNIARSEALESAIRDKVQDLERVHPHIIGCRVVLEEQHRHHKRGNLFHVSIQVSVPGRDLAVTRDSDEAHEHEDPYVALRDAFEAAERQVQADAGARRDRGARGAP